MYDHYFTQANCFEIIISQKQKGLQLKLRPC